MKFLSQRQSFYKKLFDGFHALGVSLKCERNLAGTLFQAEEAEICK